MFTIIVVVVSIALVGLLAIATIYYGGNTFSNNMASAHQSGLLSQAATIRAAVQLYETDNQGALPPADSASQALIGGNYLSEWPNGGSSAWSLQGGYALSTTDQASCLAIDKKLGLSSVPSCTDSQYQNITVCCQQ